MRRSLNLDAIASLSMIAASLFLAWTAYSITASRPKPVPPYKAGDVLALTDLSKPLQQQAALVIWVSTSCQFCAKSMPFYGRLAADPARTLRLIVMGAEPEAQLQQFFDAHKVKVDQVIGGIRDVKLQGTPMLLVLAPGLKIKSTWFGQLQNATDEAQVQAAVTEPAPVPLLR